MTAPVEVPQALQLPQEVLVAWEAVCAGCDEDTHRWRQL